MIQDLLKRFWSKVEKTDSCWSWVGYRDRAGYGRISLLCGKVTARAHRVAWELQNAKQIPAGLTVDHLCRNPRCVNPAHMEIVPMGINVMRGTGVASRNRDKTFCPKQHPLSGENLHIKKSKYGFARRCWSCERRQRKERYAKSRRS
jgi:hypothetical protein